MNTGLVLRTMLRESRRSRGRLAFFTACLGIGVLAVVGVSSIVATIQDGVRSHARELLAADLSVESRRPLSDEIGAFFADFEGSERTDVRELDTMVSVTRDDGTTSASRLVELKVVDGRYPFYGTLDLEPAGTLATCLDATSAVAGPELADELGVALGDEISIGGQRFRIAAWVRDEPDRISFSLAMGPRVFVNAAGFARTALEGFGSRVEYKALYRLPDDPTGELLATRKRDLVDTVPDARLVRVETYREAQPTLRRALRRVERFLGLVALLSLVLGGTGVAQIVRSWLAGRTESVAVLRCLGFRPREILLLYLGHVALLALVGSLLGALVGALLPYGIPRVAPALFPGSPEAAGSAWAMWQWGAVLRGVGLGVGIALVFTVPALTAIWKVPPARVLRSDAAPLAAPLRVRLAAHGALLAGLVVSAWVQADSLRVALVFSGGLVLLAAVLSGAARALVALARKLPRARLNPYLLHAVAALARPGAGSTGAIVALGLGVLVVLGMFLVERRLVEQLETALPEDAPSVFLVDIQPAQWPGVREELERSGADEIDGVPVVMARLSAIDGVDTRELADRRGPDGRARWVLRREQRLTYADELPEDNELVAGAPWDRDDGIAEISLEEGFAADLGAELGTRLAFDLQGVPVELVVTSLRSVEWQSFGINFFLVVEPGILEDAPQLRLAAARVAPDAEGPLQDRLAGEYPNVTLLRVRAIIARVGALLLRLAFGVRLLGAFTIVTGLVVLAGAISATSLRRGREVALLKTLGVTRGGVTRLLATEYALCGLVAGAIGATGALALAWAFLTRIVELPTDLPLAAIPLAALATALLAAVSGLVASARALRVRPLASLRG